MADEVHIKATHMVKPAEPTWTGTLTLTETEVTLRHVFMPMLYLYPRATAGAPIAESLRAALAKALVKFYPLTGRLKPGEGGAGEVVLVCEEAAAWVVLVEAEETSGFRVADLGGDLPEGAAWGEVEMFNHLLPAVDQSMPLDELPPLMAQLTHFRCGGVSLGLRWSHAVVDGIGMGHFLCHWSRLARGELSDMAPVHDRSLLRAGDPPKSKPPYFLETIPAPPVPPTGALTLLNMVVSKSQLDELKKMASGASSGRPYSRFEVLVAQAWRCLCRIKKEQQDDRLNVVGFAADIRKRVNPPLPLEYSGNAVITIATTDEPSSVASSPLSYACAKIRQSIENVDTEYVWRHLDQVKSLDKGHSDPQSIWTPQGQFVRPDLLLANWVTLPFYGLDFGWGKEARLLNLLPLIPNLGYIMSGREEGSIVFTICLGVDWAGKLKKYFYQDLMYASRSYAT